jgi:hypothetical protein
MNELQIKITADVKDIQSALSRVKKTLKEFEDSMASSSDVANGKLDRQKGIIEELNAKISQYKTTITRALSEKEIAKYNAKLQETQKDLARLNALGKVFEQTSVKVQEQTGLIGQLTAKLKELKSSLQQATTEKEVERLNIELAETSKELTRISSLGKVFKTTNVQVQEQNGLIAKLNIQLKELKVSLQKATSEEEVARLNAELAQTSTELSRINSLGKNITAPAVRSFDNLKKASGAATASAISFGRIIQDAPFGIIGVANNIQNFGEQFAALGGKATSAGGKLKLFFSALIQPTSLAVLAVSALTAAYQAYALGLFDAEEETKDLRTETEKFTEVLNNLENNLSAVDSARLKANKSAANELGQVELLNSVLNDTSKSENERVIVYKKLLEQYPKIIGSITQEKALTEGLGEAYNLLIASIQERAKIEAISGAFSKIQEERILLLVKERKEFLTQNELFKQRNDLLNKQSEALAKVNAKETKNADRNQALRDYSDTSAALEKLNQENTNFSNIALKTNTALKENSSTLDILKEQYGGLDQALANLSDKGKPVENLVRTFEDLSALKIDMILDRASLERLDQFSQGAELTFSSITSGAADTAKVFGKSIKEIKLQLIDFEDALNQVGLTSSQVFRAIALGSAEGFDSLNEFIMKLAGTQQFYFEASKIIEQGIEGTLGDVGFAIGRALGEGTNALEAGGAALLNGIARILNDLGQLAIGTGITIAAIKEALKSLNPVVAIAAGVALIGLAGFVSAQANKLSGGFGGGGGGGGGAPSAGQGTTFANRREFGGPVSKGRPYIVGEKRPELFVPNTNGIIIPQLPSMDYSGASMTAGAMAVDVNIRGVSYGDDILFTVQQAQIRRGIR